MKKHLKKIIEFFLIRFCSKDYQKLYKIVEKYEYISFDIFDTLIKRNVKEPTDIFNVIERKYNVCNQPIKHFQSNRIQAEKEALKKSIYEEVTLKEIYNCLNSYTQSQKEQLMKLEIETELEFCTQNKPIHKVFEYCFKHNKKIFLTSDMYLPKEVIEQILKNANYTNYQELYLSSEDRATKRSGHLFQKLLQENNIENNKIIHIGDSIIGDFLIPKKLKMHSILIKRNVNHLMFQSKNKDFDYNILSTFMNNHIDADNPYQHFGYEVLGPILYGFTTWIHQKVQDDHIDKIYFLARDAKIIMDIYKQRYKEEIPIYYLEISRRSVLNATIDNAKSFDEILDKYKSIIKKTSKVCDLIDILNLDIDEYTLNDFINKLIMDLSNNDKIQIFNEIKKDVKKQSLKQNKYLKIYLKQNDVSGNIAIVDIGWNGTIQYLLNNIVNSKTKLYGYYFGVMKDKKYKEYRFIRNGYLFDINSQNENQSIIALNIGIFETMFLSTDGTTLLYQEKNEKIKPVYGKIEYTKKDISFIADIQNMAKQFVRDLESNLVKKNLQNLSNETYFYNFKNLMIYPTTKIIKLFKNIHFQNFNRSQLIDNKNLFYYLLHPKKFYEDFMNSYCKVMFMKSVFKINLPYYWLLKKLYIAHLRK